MSNPKETPFDERRQAGTTQGHRRDPCRETNAQGCMPESVGRNGGALTSNRDVRGSDETLSLRYFQVSFGRAFPFGHLNNIWEIHLWLSGPHSKAQSRVIIQELGDLTSQDNIPIFTRLTQVEIIFPSGIPDMILTSDPVPPRAQ